MYIKVKQNKWKFKKYKILKKTKQFINLILHLIINKS